MSRLVLGLDQGTSSTRCLALDRELTVRGAGVVAIDASFPAAGLVEQDPSQLSASALAAIDAALLEAGAGPGDVGAIGIANQTETFLICERASGRPIHPAIVWQDRRTADVCERLAAAGHAQAVRSRTGLELDATFPATKIAWVLDRVQGARAAAESGALVYCDVGGWLVRHLTGLEACDVGNASRTLLCGLGAADWDDELLELFEVPRPLLAPIVDSDWYAGRTAGTGLPVAAVLGDQQASLLGLGCRSPGLAKVTLGTGAFVLAQAGPDAPAAPGGVLGSCAWRLDGEAAYALEGFVPAAGAALDWLVGLGLLPSGPQLDALLAEAGSEDSALACVPALQGLGTPGWDASVRGALFGLSRATTRAQVARAAIDGIVHQVADALDAIRGAMELETVLLDGGMSRSDWIAQRIADLASVQVRRSRRAEATAIGAAIAAGLATGFWSHPRELPEVEVDLVAEPALTDAHRASLRERWADAVALASRW